MADILFSGLIRPHVTSKRKVLKSIRKLIKFLELNGMNAEARKYLRQIEKLELDVRIEKFKR